MVALNIFKFLSSMKSSKRIIFINVCVGKIWCTGIRVCLLYSHIDKSQKNTFIVGVMNNYLSYNYD